MIRYAIPVLALMSMLSACSTSTPDEQTVAVAQSQAAAEATASRPPEPVIIAPAFEGNCDDTQAQWVIGKTMDEAQLEQARKDAKATIVRSLKPGQMVTMEFHPGRLNVDLDQQGKALAARCG